jgi:hypothetical protein
MEFLGHTLIWDWCRQNGYALDEGVGMVAPKLANDPSLVDGARIVHTAAGDVEASQALAFKNRQDARRLGPLPAMGN